MAKSYYLPTNDKERVVWLRNFSTKFPGYAPTLGFTAAEVTSVTNDIIAFSFHIDIIETFKTELRERNSYKDILRDGPIGATQGALPLLPPLPTAPPVVPAGIFPRIASIVKRIKAHPIYTVSIGKDLGIIGAEPAIDQSSLRPTLRIKKTRGVIIVSYIRGSNHGIQLHSKRGDEPKYTLLSVVTKSSYRDTRPNLIPGQPETRHYQAWFIQNDQMIGLVSGEESILV